MLSNGKHDYVHQIWSSNSVSKCLLVWYIRTWLKLETIFANYRLGKEMWWATKLS